jgi:hypothetical protein
MKFWDWAGMLGIGDIRENEAYQAGRVVGVVYSFFNLVRGFAAVVSNFGAWFNGIKTGAAALAQSLRPPSLMDNRIKTHINQPERTCP